MAPQPTKQATARLKKELLQIKKDPVPGVVCEPLDNDILTWYYALKGPLETPYEGGIYVGKLQFPPDYPWKPPAIYMLTPSGRFEISKKICMSMSDFHPESWNPMWNVGTIITGIISFMTSDEMTTGGIKTTTTERKRLATASHEYNQKHYSKLFQGSIKAAFQQAEETIAAVEQQRRKNGDNANTSASPHPGRRRQQHRTANTTTISNTKESTTSQEGNENDAVVDDNNNGASVSKELTAEQIEKRRQKNAKKRAKQKAKKKAAAAEVSAAGGGGC